MNKLSFCKNWNNKLDCEYFTTIRLSTSSNREYYFDSLNKVFDVRLKDKSYCKASLESMNEYSLHNLCDKNDYLVTLDTGLSVDKFYKLMERFYNRKKEWQEGSTFFLVLLFRRSNET